MKGYIKLDYHANEYYINIDHIVAIEPDGGMVYIYLSNGKTLYPELSFDELLEMIEQAREVDNG